METICWDDLRFLLAVHRSGSLLAAGNALGVSTSTVGRRIDALEAAAQLKLVYRSQEGAELTPTAAELVRLAQALENGLNAQRRDQHRIAGTIRMSVPDGMALSMAQALLTFQHEFPAIDIELIGENQRVDLATREADLAIRLTRSTSNVLVEKKLATLQFSLYAAEEYVRRYLPGGHLRREDAASQRFIGLDSQWKNLAHERWMVQLGASRFAFRSSSIDAIVEAVRQGAGIAALLDKDARSDGLVRLTAETAGPVQDFYLVYHRDLRAAPHLRAAVKAIEAYVRRYR